MIIIIIVIILNFNWKYQKEHFMRHFHLESHIDDDPKDNFVYDLVQILIYYQHDVI